jgi:hypothetical protein
LGEYTVPIKLHRDVTATVKVLVEPDEGTKAKLKAAAEAQARTNAKAEAKATAASKGNPAEQVPPAEVPETAPEAEEESA